MKVKSNIKSLQSLLPFLGLTLLLLLSPCRVRNFIQAELGLTQTEVSNKSVTTANNCNTLESSETEQTLSKVSFKKAFLPAENSIYFAIKSDLSLNRPTKYQTASKFSSSLAPLYILYSNLKVYL